MITLYDENVIGDLRRSVVATPPPISTDQGTLLDDMQSWRVKEYDFKYIDFMIMKWISLFFVVS